MTLEAPAPGSHTGADSASGVYTLLLGIAQDAGIPQVGAWEHPGWSAPEHRRRVVSLGLVDQDSGKRWLFDATPDFRSQLADLARARPSARSRPVGGLEGIFLTHAHIGHYTGLMFLGHESMGAHGVPVYAMPRMGDFLRHNGPWDQLVRYQNIELMPLAADTPIDLGAVRVTPVLVPHRQEYSEVVGYRIDGPRRSVLFLPDIDSWSEWDAAGSRLEDVLATVDVAYLDATFYANGEIPGRDMTGFPHPFITQTMERLKDLRAAERGKVHFLHLNHTNPAQFADHEARLQIENSGFAVAQEGERVEL